MEGDYTMKFNSILVAALSCVTMAACSTSSSGSSAGLSDAAMAPLNDLNLRRDEIPKLLQDIRSPYEPIPDVSCKAIGDTVTALTIILGRDSDAEPLPEKTFGDKASQGASDMTLDGISSAMTDFIPFRSLVRDATGANRHDRRLRAAYERGVARRAYLKGVGAHLGCAPPAAPDPSAGIPKDPDAEFRGTSQAS